MYSEVIARLQCPACGSAALSWKAFVQDSEGLIADGVVYCTKCRCWYPIEEGLLDFMIGGLAYEEDRQRFWQRHSNRLKKLDIEDRCDTAAGVAVDAQRKQQAHFDKWASDESQTYTQYESSPFWRAMDAMVFDAWRRELKPGDWLLDVGCAQGRSTQYFMDADIQIVAFDVSKALVKQAIQRYRLGKCRARATFFAADATRFPLQDNAFNWVVLYGVLHHLPNVELACSEIARVLAPHGVYLGHENNKTIFRSAFDLLQCLWPMWHEEAGREPLLAAKDLQRWFSRTGVNVQTTTSVFVPPHLVNLAPRRLGRWLFCTSDWVGRAIPFVRNHGGIILIRGEKLQSSQPPSNATKTEACSVANSQ